MQTAVAMKRKEDEQNCSSVRSTESKTIHSLEDRILIIRAQLNYSDHKTQGD